MDHNPLKTLPPRAFHLAGLINVQKVYMKNCSLNDLSPTALGGLVILIELDLSENNLYELRSGTFQVN
jgi:Leucine-rich repeat (LRR) protein